MITKQSRRNAISASSESALPGQVVLAMQGGGALGAFQAGVYEAMHEAGIEPDWVLGTSIGAINGAIIAGNTPKNRLPRLREFWARVAGSAALSAQFDPFALGDAWSKAQIMLNGISGFFATNPLAWLGVNASVGAAKASFYTTAPLRETLDALVDFEHLAKAGPRFTVGAVNALNGDMRYFDSRDDHLAVEHVMASGALPPAFPAVFIDGAPYWDGGIHSNTPIEVVMEDDKRRDSVIFAAQVWQREGAAGDSINEVMDRMKNIQYASRSDTHIAREQKIHHLRHVIRALGQALADTTKDSAEVAELMRYGCGTVMHVLPLRAPPRDGEDHTKDIDFTPEGIEARWSAGYALTRQRIEAAPWTAPFDPDMGVIVHP